MTRTASRSASPARTVVNRMFEAFSAKDLQGALETVTDDTLWIHHGSQKLRALRFEGKSGVEKFFLGSFAAKFDYFRPLSFIEEGDTVIVIGEESFAMDGVGKAINRWVQVYSIEGGLIAGMEEFATSAGAEDYAVVK